MTGEHNISTARKIHLSWLNYPKTFIQICTIKRMVHGCSRYKWYLLVPIISLTRSWLICYFISPSRWNLCLPCNILYLSTPYLRLDKSNICYYLSLYERFLVSVGKTVQYCWLTLKGKNVSIWNRPSFVPTGRGWSLECFKKSCQPTTALCASTQAIKVVMI